MYNQKAQAYHFKLNDLFNKHFPELIFFKSILLRKYWHSGGGLLFEVGVIGG